MDYAAKIAPYIRISLYLATGMFAGEALDAQTVDLIRTDPALLAGLSGGVAFIWYRIAKRRGWAT